MAVEHYDYRSPETHADADVPHGAGYYRHAHAPPVDPLEQSRAEVGRILASCEEYTEIGVRPNQTFHCASGGRTAAVKE